MVSKGGWQYRLSESKAYPATARQHTSNSRHPQPARIHMRVFFLAGSMAGGSAGVYISSGPAGIWLLYTGSAGGSGEKPGDGGMLGRGGGVYAGIASEGAICVTPGSSVCGAATMVASGSTLITS